MGRMAGYTYADLATFPDADRIEVHVLQGGGYVKPVIYEPGDTLVTELLPGLEIDVAAILAR